jgi:hypothetical protein
MRQKIYGTTVIAELGISVFNLFKSKFESLNPRYIRYSVNIIIGGFCSEAIDDNSTAKLYFFATANEIAITTNEYEKTSPPVQPIYNTIGLTSEKTNIISL